MAAGRKPRNPVPNASSARQAILEATVSAIDAGGEASVRITEVAKEAGVTQGMISYYFGDREGLVAEAHLMRFRTTVDQDTDFLVSAVESARDIDHFYSILKVITREVVKVSRSSSRMARVVIIGSSVGRPDLHDTVTATQCELVDQLERVVNMGVERGFIRTDRNPRAIAEFISAYTLGLVVADMDPSRPDDEELALVIDSFMLSMRPD
ncbi:MAG: hypothetical protein RL573_976 [Actinomycetota bacterium]